VSDNPFDLSPHIAGKNADELLDYLATSGAQPGSAVAMAIRTALDVRIAEIQRDAARAAVRWAMLEAVGTLVAATIALAALLIAVL